MEHRLMRIEEVAMVLDCNQITLERWYRFKRENPEHEMSKKLPDFMYGMNIKNRPVRLWKSTDIPKLKEFQDSVVKGTKGFMGSVSNLYLKKKGDKKNGKKETGRSGRQVKKSGKVS